MTTYKRKFDTLETGTAEMWLLKRYMCECLKAFFAIQKNQNMNL